MNACVSAHIYIYSSPSLSYTILQFVNHLELYIYK